MLFFIFIVILNFIHLLSQDCQDYQIEEDQPFYSKDKQSLIIEQDDQNVNIVEYRMNQNLIEKSFTIILVSQGQVIQSKVIEPLDQTQRLQKWICNLMKSSNYFITYQNIFGLNDIYNELTQNYVVEINSISGEICEEFFGGNNNTFIVFCYSINYLNVYTVYIKNNSTQLLYQYNLSNLNITQCQRTYIELQNSQFIFALHKCENWNVIHLDLNKIIVNQTILYEINTNIQIKQLFDIQICEKSKYQQLTLIEDNIYVIIDWTKSQIILFNIFEKKIKKVLLGKQCLLQQVLFESDFGQIFNLKGQFIAKFDTQYEIHFVNDRLFIYNKNQISLIFTQNINYTIQIPKYQIKFIKTNNYFYQIDEELKQIQFYKYHAISSFIKPTKKYLFVFNINQQSFTLDFLLCYRIVKINQNEENICQIHTQVVNQCQSEIALDIYKYTKKNNLYYELQTPKMLESESHKQNTFDQIYLCKPLFQKLNYILLANTNSSALLLKQDILRFISCNDKCQDILININGMQLFSKNNLFWLFKLGVNQARILQFDQNDCLSIQTFQIEYVPDKLTQFGTILLIQSKEQLPLIFSLIPNSNQQIKQYIPENQFFSEEILYYKGTNKQTYIQYSNFLIIEKEQLINYVRIQDTQIIYLIQFGNGFQVIGVHKFLNILINYYILDYEIQYSQNATYQDYSFVRPIVYYFYHQFMILLAIKQEQMYLLIMELHNEYEIQWIQSIKCNSKYFFFKNDKLIYQDENNQTREIDIYHILLQINYVNSTQSTLVDLQTYPIQLVSSISGNSIECQLKLYIDNQCNKLQLNQFIETQLVSKTIVLPKYFYGPIYNASISYNNNLSFRGPFLRDQQLQECKSKSELNCILKATLLNNQQEIQCYNIALNNQIHHITCQILNTNFNQKHDQTLDLNIFQISKYQLIQFWIDQNFQVCYQIIFYDNKIGSFISESIHQIQIIIINKNSFKVKNIGKLIIIQIGDEQQLFHLQGNELLSISSKFELNNSICFQNNGNLFLQYQLIKTDIQFEIKLSILKLEETSISQLGIINLNYLQLTNLIMPLIPYNEIQQKFRSLQQSDFIIVICKHQQNSIQVQIAQKFSDYLVIYDLQFNKLYQFQQGIVSKVLRNYNQLNNLIYMENQTLIIGNLIYDVTLDKSFYDPIYKITEKDFKIHQFNTTHVIFESQNDSEFSFGQFGYEIQQLNVESEIEKFNLIVTNGLATLQVELMLMNKKQTKGIFILLLIISFLILIAFIIYQIRREKLKIRNYFKAPS